MDHFSKTHIDATKASTPNDYRSVALANKKSRVDRPMFNLNSSIFDSSKNSASAFNVQQRRQSPSIISQYKDSELKQGSIKELMEQDFAFLVQN